MDENIQAQTEYEALGQLNDTIIRSIKADIANAESYQQSVIEPLVKDRYNTYYADKDYYAAKFPILSKTSNLVSTDVADTIEWAMPSLMKVFAGSDEVITIVGVTEEDDVKAEVMQDLCVYQLQRQNKFFPVLYNWMKDALITGMGIVKCYWERTEGATKENVILNARALGELSATGVNITSVEGPDSFNDYRVEYDSPYYIKNSPKIENILVSEFLYDPNAKTLEEANFVAHKKKVTLSYLREREQQGIYSNIDAIKSEAFAPGFNTDLLENTINDEYYNINTNNEEEARREVTIYECYTKIDINGDGILEDVIVTVAGDTVIRLEENYMGRHPFFVLSPTKDPHRIWAKRSYAELIGELQDLKVALTRQIMRNVALTNDPKMILSEDAINIDDYVKGRSVIRKKAGHTMADVAMSMPVNQLSPYTFNFLEYIEGQKEARTGITRYNQGLDANSLNKTASGINAILGQSAQRLELVARMFAETGIYELFRFLISLNQKFIDQDTVVRLTNKELKISPDDLNGNFDLVVNAGISIASKESTIQTLQTMLTAIMQVNAAGYQLATPENIYNMFKKWIEAAGFKNYSDYITDPAVTQQRMMIEMGLKQQVLSQLPPQVMQQYVTTGMLPPDVMLQLPPEVQVLFDGAGNTQGDPNSAIQQAMEQGNGDPQNMGDPTASFGGFGGATMSSGIMPNGDNQHANPMQQGFSGNAGSIGGF